MAERDIVMFKYEGPLFGGREFNVEGYGAKAGVVNFPAPATPTTSVICTAVGMDDDARRLLCKNKDKLRTFVLAAESEEALKEMLAPGARLAPPPSTREKADWRASFIVGLDKVSIQPPCQGPRTSVATFTLMAQSRAGTPLQLKGRERVAVWLVRFPFTVRCTALTGGLCGRWRAL